MRKLIQKILNKIPKRCEHEYFLYVTTGDLAVQKCFICGSESIPWRVKPETGKEWRKSNPDATAKMVQADLNAKAYWEKF